MSDQRILLYDQTEPFPKQIRGGNGLALARQLIGPENPVPGSPFTSVGVSFLPPGVSAGVHRHEGTAEAYVVISGSGLYTNKDGEQIRVKQGDLTLCYDGEIHGMENDGDEPLIMAGIVAKKG